MSTRPRLGGQAVIEGVMIRSGDRLAVAVRRPDGEIVLRQTDVPSWAGSVKKIPVVRGAMALVSTVVLGMKALAWSKDVAEGTTGKPPRKGATAAATAVSLLVLVGIFGVLPAAIGHALTGGGMALAAVEAVVRLALFVGYVAAIGRLPAIQRTFEYHGAEHQAVAAYEAGAPLTVESVRRFSPRHARCGTDFLVLVALVAIAAFAFVSPESWVLLVASRILLLPVVAGVAYEVLRLSDHPAAGRWLRPLLAPGLAVQRLTTRPPADDQVEVAIAAVQAALALRS